VEEHATQKARLARVALIGIFGSTQSPRALIRLPRGDTQAVTLGDRVAGSTVEAIGADRIVLSRMGRRETLWMPQG
jgi:type II secretory pathway component PulC